MVSHSLVGGTSFYKKRNSAHQSLCRPTTKQSVISYHLANRLDAADDAEKDEYPSEEQTESEIPLDDVCVNVYAFRYSQHFMPTCHRQRSYNLQQYDVCRGHKADLSSLCIRREATVWISTLSLQV